MKIASIVINNKYESGTDVLCDCDCDVMMLKSLVHILKCTLKDSFTNRFTKTAFMKMHLKFNYEKLRLSTDSQAVSWQTSFKDKESTHRKKTKFKV